MSEEEESFNVSQRENNLLPKQCTKETKILSNLNFIPKDC